MRMTEEIEKDAKDGVERMSKLRRSQGSERVTDVGVLHLILSRCHNYCTSQSRNISQSVMSSLGNDVGVRMDRMR